MKSPVFFIAVEESDSLDAVSEKFKKVLNASGMEKNICSNDDVVVKMHFGEEGNTGFVKPELVGVLSKTVAQSAKSITVSDTNTLYRGRRVNSEDHEKLAREHGFIEKTIHAKLLVPNEKVVSNCQTVPIDQVFVKEAKILALYKNADVLIGLSHFKGHLVTGFGGSLKNIGMGCASREGKLSQHSNVCPTVYVDKCTGCGDCAAVCPVDAIGIIAGKSKINPALCIGCASCIAACSFYAMDVNWGSGADAVADKMVEFAYAVLHGKKKLLFVNVATKITAECDCLAKDDPRIVDDVGIFVSHDPVAADTAAYDLVCKKAGGKDVFAEAHPGRKNLKQLIYAEKLGLGSRDYELITVS